MKKTISIIFAVIILSLATVPVSAMFPSMVVWRDTVYFPREAGKMYSEEYIEENYTLVGEIELVVENDAEIPRPSAEDKATSNGFSLGDKIYKGNDDGKIYILVSETYQPITGRTRLMPLTAEMKYMVLAAGIEEPVLP